MKLGRHQRRKWSRRVVSHLSLSLDMVNRPRLYLYRDGELITIGVAWGNGYSDPVWSFDLEVWRHEAP